MLKYNIFGSEIKLNDDLDYYEYYSDYGLFQVDFPKLLKDIEEERIEINDELKNALLSLKRWIHEAPRKRY